jgi:hypothetical protein
VYSIHDLPIEVQFSPVYAFATGDFNSDGYIDVLSAGNFYGSTPAIGRFDASYGNCLTGSKEGTFRIIEPRDSGFSVFGESRDMKLIRSKEGMKILVSRNNAAPRLFSIVSSNKIL